MTMKKMKYMLSALFVAAVSLVSCQEKEGEENEKVAYFLEFVNQEDASLEFTPDFNGTYQVKLNTNIPKRSLKISDVLPQTWCSADFNESGDAVEITPGLATTSDLTAKFIIESSEAGVNPLSLEVKRLYQAVEHMVKISVGGDELTGEYPMYEVSGSQNSVAVTVQTNASQWTMSYDYYMDDAQWFTVDKLSGRNGEACTFTFDKNESGMARNQTFVFKPGFAGTDVAVSLTFIQKAWSSIESVTVRNFNPSSMTAGEVIPDGYTVTIPNTNTARSPFCYTVDIVGEGGIDIKFAEAESSELSYSDWLFSGRKTIEDSEYNVIGYYYTLSTMENFGEQRTIDMIIVAAGTQTELFRMHVIQSAGN